MQRAPRTLLPTLAIALATSLACAALAPAASTDRGEVTFNNHCRTCHSTKPDDNRMGPSLHGIFGAKAGSVSGYGSYSQGLKGSGIVWDEKTLDQFIANPDSVVPSNNMKPYKGITDPAVRAQIVSYLKSSAREGAQASTQ
jgi:cytochrome c